MRRTRGGILLATLLKSESSGGNEYLRQCMARSLSEMAVGSRRRESLGAPLQVCWAREALPGL